MTGGVLVIGYGNPLRGDDGIGPAVAAKVAALNFPAVWVMVVHQLTPELAADLAAARLAVFVDAAAGGKPVAAVRLGPSPDGDVMTHAADPRGLLALAQAVFGRAPEAWLVTAAGADFGFRNGLSETGAANARDALGSVTQILLEATGA